MVEATKQTGRRVEPPANWDILSANEPGDEKLDEWGWDRITSGQKKQHVADGASFSKKGLVCMQVIEVDKVSRLAKAAKHMKK